MKKYLAFLILSIIVYSCQDSNYFEENKIINNRSWEYSGNPTFNVHIDDVHAKYDFYINLRHTNFYPYANLVTHLHVKGNKLKETQFASEIKLALKGGEWVGKNAGSLYEVQHLVKKEFTFPDTGMYVFTIEQNMKDNPLKHINDVGLKIIKK